MFFPLDISPGPPGENARRYVVSLAARGTARQWRPSVQNQPLCWVLKNHRRFRAGCPIRLKRRARPMVSYADITALRDPVHLSQVMAKE